MIKRARVADDVDALDIGARAFRDVICDVDSLGVGIALDARIDLGEDKSLVGGFERQVLDRLVDLGGVIGVAHAGLDLGAQCFGLKVAVTDVDGNVGHVIARAFLDHEVDGEAITVVGCMRIRRDDLHIGKTVLQVIAAQQFLVIGETVSVEGGVAQEEQELRIFLGGDDVLEVAVAEAAVARESDLLDVGLAAFVHVEHQVDAVLRQANELWRHRDVVEALLLIDRENAARVARHAGLCENDAFARFNFLHQGVVIDFLVALDVDNVDERILGNGNDKGVALADDAHVAEQARLEKGLDRFIDLLVVELVTDAKLHVGKDGFVLDALVTADENLGNCGSIGRLQHDLGGHHRCGPENQHQAYNQFQKSQMHQVLAYTNPGPPQALQIRPWAVFYPVHALLQMKHLGFFMFRKSG